MLFIPVVCLAQSRGSAALSNNQALIISVAKFHYSEYLGNKGLIARLTVEGKDPSTEFLKSINSGISGYFAAGSDIDAAKKADNFREINFGEIKKIDDGWYVFATVGVFPPADRLLRFRVRQGRHGFVVVSAEQLSGFVDAPHEKPYAK
jgi:hypothetical protein